MGFPAQIRVNAAAVLNAVEAATPGSMAQVSTARVASPAAFPCAWVDEVRSTIVADASTRSWRAEADVWMVFSSFDNEDAQDAADLLLGLVIDAFSDDPHWAGAETVGEPRSFRTDTFDVGGQSYPAYVLTLGEIYLTEGRSSI